MQDSRLQKLTSSKSIADLANNDQLAEIGKIRNWFKARDVEKKMHSGYRCLFHGPPGTGKKTLATVIGNETGSEVYRIDLSMLLSKYIGETEKNLAAIFDAAEDKGWILFFDEADALFGKRTGVKDAHDRYANQEIAYLLQRIEDYNGLIILAMSMKKNIDDAFIRRLNCVIDFKEKFIK